LLPEANEITHLRPGREDLEFIARSEASTIRKVY